MKREECRVQKETTIFARRLSFLFGGDGETRTLAPVSQPTPLAGAPRHQLEYISESVTKKGYAVVSPDGIWRRGRDSNPWL